MFSVETLEIPNKLWYGPKLEYSVFPFGPKIKQIILRKYWEACRFRFACLIETFRPFLVHTIL